MREGLFLVLAVFAALVAVTYSDCYSDDYCSTEYYGDHTCYNNHCFHVCTSDRECARVRTLGWYYGERMDKCDVDNRRCVMCKVHDDCARSYSGKFCNNNSGTCVKNWCNVDADCERNKRGNTCHNNQCVTLCASDDECSGRWGVCNPDKGRCVRKYEPLPDYHEYHEPKH